MDFQTELLLVCIWIFRIEFSDPALTLYLYMNLYVCYKYVIYTESQTEIPLVFIWMFRTGFLRRRAKSSPLYGSMWMLQKCNLYVIPNITSISLYMNIPNRIFKTSR